MATKKKMLMSAAGSAGGAGLDITDVFSTSLYTGNATERDITTGIDLAGEDGLLWVKNRSSTSDHSLFSPLLGARKSLNSNSTQSAYASTSPSPADKDLKSFNSDGFSIFAAGYNANLNVNGFSYTSWTFRKAPKFLDIVTYTGSGTNGRQIAHNLGGDPGMIFIKSTTSTSNADWSVWHRSLPNRITGNPNRPYTLKLNTTDEQSGNDSIGPCTSEYIVTGQDASRANASGVSYVAYVFAHNDGDGEFGPDSDQDIIKCGSFTAGANVDVDIGFEPQWVLVRNSLGGHWIIVDSMRGFLALPGDSPYSRGLRANDTTAERNSQIQVTSTGFSTNANAEMGFSGTCIYMAIRRGPLAPPESATEVFAPNFYGTSGYAGYLGAPADMSMLGYRSGNSQNAVIRTRMLPNTKGLVTSSNSAEVTTNSSWDNMSGVSPVGSTLTTLISYTFKRAPNFFDVVTYSGNSTAGRTVSHNLGVAPEMMWIKSRNNARSWRVYHSSFTNGSVRLDSAASKDTSTNYFSTPTADNIILGSDNDTNRTAYTYIAYLFASLPGISKVGSYTGTGAAQDIDCGFTAGARFILLKKTSGTGSWYLFDSTRGIVAGNDPYIYLNLTNAEVTSRDAVDPLSSGFSLTTDSTFNASGASYIFYAIA
jgi:hypothetical protein